MNIPTPGLDRTRVRRWATAAGAAALLAMLASCGSDDGTPPSVTAAVASNQPPASASQGVDGFIAYLKTVVPTRLDTADPVDVALFVAPTSDTSDPDPSI